MSCPRPWEVNGGILWVIRLNVMLFAILIAPLMCMFFAPLWSPLIMACVFFHAYLEGGRYAKWHMERVGNAEDPAE